VKRRLANEESYSWFIEILRHYHQAKSQSKRTVLLDATRCSQRGSQNWNSLRNAVRSNEHTHSQHAGAT
jgi:hypothetical protein